MWVMPASASAASATSREHSSLDGVPGFQGDMIITLPDVANELIEKNLPQKIVGIANIVDKNEIKIKLEEAFIELEKQ